MRTLELTYRGDTGVYVVTLSTTREGRFRFSCTCDGAENGYQCKHRIAILEGNLSRVSSDDRKTAEAIRSELNGSDIENFLDAWRAAEADVKRYKQAFVKALMGK